ncbi:unnamed protein product [Sphenostylis stenocarpa]|uniref:Uncharacterized protein n=1 Tax=Sphenostylis stenocarpa TaxID=92480 RepID=A0AA86RXU3_9FABA|nr:unnamed protein product [Sphenostylis stenocarpa]
MKRYRQQKSEPKGASIPILVPNSLKHVKRKSSFENPNKKRKRSIEKKMNLSRDSSGNTAGNRDQLKRPRFGQIRIQREILYREEEKLTEIEKRKERDVRRGN